MRKIVYTYKLIVEGRRSFPIDMLRYDSCVPWDQSDANAIERSVCEVTRDVPVRLTLRRFALDKVDLHQAERRWESFGWKVVSYEPEE